MERGVPNFSKFGTGRSKLGEVWKTETLSVFKFEDRNSLVFPHRLPPIFSMCPKMNKYENTYADEMVEDING